MPRNTRHDERGILGREGGMLFLKRDDGGGVWRPDALAKAHDLIGRRVRLSGTRDGFDLLAVDRIEME